MSTEAAVEPAEPVTPHEVKVRSESEFDARMKAVSQPIEANVVSATSVAKVEAKVEAPAETKDGIPSFVTEGEPTPPVVAKDDELEAITPPAKMNQEGTKNFAQLRALAGQRGEEAKRLAAELEALKKQKPSESADPQTAEELKALREERDKLNSELERAAFERSPRYKAMLDKQGASLAAAKSYLEGTEIHESVIDRAASVTGAKRLAILREAGADAETIAAITATLAGHDTVASERTAAMEQHKTLQAEWQRGEQARAQQNETRQKAEEDKVFESVSKQIESTFTPFKKYDGHEKWNAQADALRVEAKAILNAELPFEKLVEAAHAAAGYKVLDSINQKVIAENKALKAENAALKTAQPGGGATNGSRATSNGNGALDGSAASVADRFDQRMGR